VELEVGEQFNVHKSRFVAGHRHEKHRNRCP
jgi:hypothetical protein